ncbi:ferritin-like domain-containing protein [Kitasatospora sp. RB6PN24]|uniref:ferritin-like domain-containing protein n=1 Tax=Kitasatospora humi TaxID=2893891 RepID=UPI001E558B66|nr:ferritin-like domain-containing protein [Kitasatospora humi]MCC9311380.1 ferritin-like domain-containing protein [Kitasatospora humi]
MQSPSRRTFLATGALAAAGLLTACTAGSGAGSGAGGKAHDRAGAPETDPDLPLRTRAVAGADALLVQYAAVPAAAGGGAPLDQLRTEVTAERAALAAGLPGSAAASGSPSAAASGASGSPSGSPSGPPGGSPSGSPGGAAGLAAAERSTAMARLADLSTASPELARLLAAVAAAGALRAVRLGDRTPLPAPADQPSTAPASAAPSASGTPGATASPGATDAPSATAVTALQEALAAEHAAVYAFGVVGAKLPPGPGRDDARSCYAAHQARRDAWDRLLTGAGATPTAAAPGYRLPFPVPDATAAGRLAAEVEQRLTAVYGDLVAATAGDLRARAAAALSTAVLQCAHWGGTPGPLPGVPAGTAAAATATDKPSTAPR